MKKKLTRFDLQNMKESGKKAVWVTAYDYWTAQFAEQAGMDMILVGDSLGMCIYGYEGTIPVTMDQCIYHSEAVRRGAPNTFIIGDMPFLSYQSIVTRLSVMPAAFSKKPGSTRSSSKEAGGSVLRSRLFQKAACWSWGISVSHHKARASWVDSKPRDERLTRPWS
jgi:3-methyl-2-oxobutanoate hydroxymethyltransferase